MKYALPLPVEIAFEAKRHRKVFEATAEQMLRATYWRAVWARSRGPIAAALLMTCASLWAAKWHEEKVARLERENAELLALLRAERVPVTVIATGCGRAELLDHLSAASAQFDDFRWKLRRAP